MTISFHRLATSRLPRLCLSFLLALLLMAPSGLPAAATAKKAPATKKTTTARKAPARKASTAKRTTTAKKRTTTRRARTTRARRTTRTARRRGPVSPSADRLKEIQTALASAGFYSAEPNGKWDDQSIAAMKQFQEQHSLKPSGKIDSLSLIALGLGPKRGPAPGMASVLETPDSANAEKADR